MNDVTHDVFVAKEFINVVVGVMDAQEDRGVRIRSEIDFNSRLYSISLKTSSFEQ